MHIEKVRVEGFRLLQDVEIMLEPKSTVIVGRNNSGKTSLTEIFDRFMGESGTRFRLEDFSAGIRRKFFDAKTLREQKELPEEVLKVLPKIALTLTFAYEIDEPDLGPLSPFIIDLDEDSTIAIVRIEYASTIEKLHMLLDVSPAETGIDPQEHFLRTLRESLSRAYSVHVCAIDPTDDTNRRQFEGLSALDNLIRCDFIRAQRTLDHSKNKDTDVIGKLLSNLFKTASAPTAAVADQELAAQLKSSVQSIERNVQNDFDDMLKNLLPAMEVLGFPGLDDTELRPETSLNVESLLSDHTKVVYTGVDGIHLPEGYNGLGTRNLIYMLLQLESYHKVYRAKPTRPVTHLLFIEEPEAHLHPQMQEVFINQLNAAIEKLSASYPTEPVWKVQFVITTHSSHIANAASFEALRYFLNQPPVATSTRQTKIKDFKKGMSKIPQEDQDFLHQYMTLTKCDLYFADKAILVEGTTERLLMPRLCAIVDQSLDEQHKLSRQYVTCVEVGGAYAHKFYPLIDFLELKTLIITDLDAIQPIKKPNKEEKLTTVWKKCPVAQGEKSSNAALNTWFRPKNESQQQGWQLTIADLMAKTATEKHQGYRRIAYQIPEQEASSVCARSYEDALILANPDRFNLPKEDDEATEAWHLAKDLPKAETALRFAIIESNWNVPRYIREGLIWLSEPPPPPNEPPPVVIPNETSSIVEAV